MTLIDTGLMTPSLNQCLAGFSRIISLSFFKFYFVQYSHPMPPGSPLDPFLIRLLSFESSNTTSVGLEAYALIDTDAWQEAPCGV